MPPKERKMKLFLIAFCVVSFALALWGSQIKHAPTVGQCRADQALWLSELEAPNGERVKDVTIGTLIDWDSEMTVCFNIDKRNSVKYDYTRFDSGYEQYLRYFNF